MLATHSRVRRGLWIAHLRSLPRGARDALFLIAVATITLIPLATNVPAWTIAGSAGLLTWRAFLAWRNRPLPPRRLLALVLLAAVGSAMLQFHTVFGRDPGVTLICLLLGLKALETRNRRDTYVLFYLGFFAVVVNFLYSQSALSCAWMLVATSGWLTALVNANLPVGQPPLTQRLLLTGKLMALGTPAMVLLFVFFPRLAGPLWALPDTARSTTGLSDSMDAGSIAKLARNDGVAFRVKFHGARPPQRDLYWRGPVLTEFNGRQWRSQPATPAQIASRLDRAHNFQAVGPAVRYTVTLQPSQQPFIFALDAPERAPVLRGEIQATVVQRSTLDLVASRPISRLTRYNLTSYPNFVYGRGVWTARLKRDLQLPRGDNPRTVAFAVDIARKVQREGGTKMQVVQTVLQMFRHDPFYYSLEPGVYRGRNQIDHFLFDRRIGFCEHYAQAFVVLMRAAGIPARIVTGYQGGRENPIDHTWVVRQSDAHAWAEYWIAGRGWLRADPTAMVDPSRVDRSGFTLTSREPLLGIAALGPRDTPLLLRLRNLSDALNNAWNQWVLDYGQSRQSALLRSLGMGQPDWRQLSALAIAGLSAAVSLTGLFLMWESRKVHPWDAAYAALRKRLADVGVQSTVADTPAILEARLRRSTLSPGAITDACGLLNALERWRYAKPPNDGDKRHARRLEELRLAIKRLQLPAPAAVHSRTPK